MFEIQLVFFLPFSHATLSSNGEQEYKTDFMLAHKQEKPGLRPFKVKNLKVKQFGTTGLLSVP